MSEENVQLVRRATEAWNTGGIEALLPFYPEDVLWYPFPGAPMASELHGHAGIREVMQGWDDSFDDWSIRIEEIRDLGDTVVGLNEISGTIRGTGVEMRQPMAGVVWDFRGDGTAGRAAFFSSWDEAVEFAEERRS